MLRDITSSKERTLDFLKKQHIIANEVLCPGPCVSGKRAFNCGKYMELKVTNDNKDKYMWRCRKTHTVTKGDHKYKCKDIKLSIRFQSWLVDCKLSLELVLELMYLWSQAFSLHEIIHELKLSKKTVIEWSTFLRECCISAIIDHSEPIGGNGVEVEIDESKFGKRKYHRGHRVEGQWVFGGREKYDKSKIFMIPVPNRKAVTLEKIIKKWIKPGSIIHSDCWKAYSRLGKMGYTHVTVNHSKEFKNIETAACTNCIESEWRHAKVAMPKYGVHKGLHAGYLAEFMWRRLHYQEDKFLQLIKDVNAAYKRKYLSKCPTS